MKKIALILIFSFLIFGCRSVEEMTAQQLEERAKAASVFQEHTGPLNVVGFFSLSSEQSKNIPRLVETMQKKFGKDVKMEFRRSWEDRTSLIADEASECARDQGKLKEFLDIYFRDYFEDFARDTMIEIALQTKLDMKKFETCLDSGAMKDRIFRDKSFAEDFGVNVSKEFYEFIQMTSKDELRN